MQLVWAFIGIMATWTALKFVFKVFKRLGSKTTIDRMLDRAEDSIDDAADKIAGYWKDRKKRKKDEERPIVTIR